MSDFPFAATRVRLGLTQAELAKIVGVSKRSIVNVEVSPDLVSDVMLGRVETTLRDLLADAPATTDERVKQLAARVDALAAQLAARDKRIADIEATLRLLVRR